MAEARSGAPLGKTICRIPIKGQVQRLEPGRQPEERYIVPWNDVLKKTKFRIPLVPDRFRTCTIDCSDVVCRWFLTGR